MAMMPVPRPIAVAGVGGLHEGFFLSMGTAAGPGGTAAVTFCFAPKGTVRDHSKQTLTSAYSYTLLVAHVAIQHLEVLS